MLPEHNDENRSQIIIERLIEFNQNLNLINSEILSITNSTDNSATISINERNNNYFGSFQVNFILNENRGALNIDRRNLNNNNGNNQPPNNGPGGGSSATSKKRPNNNNIKKSENEKPEIFPEITNKYNSLSKEEKLKKLNEINRYYQTLSENDKKAFKEKLRNIGLGLTSTGISGAGILGISKMTGISPIKGLSTTANYIKNSLSSTRTAVSTGTAEEMEMTPLLAESSAEGLEIAETITVAETAAVEGGIIAGETGTAAALAPETLGLSLVIGGLVIAGTWMYFAFHHHATSDIALPTSIHHNVYDNIEKWYKFLAHDKLKIKINKNTWNEIKQNKNSPANIIKIIKNKFVINDHSGWGGSVTNEDFNTFVKVIVLHFEQINGYFEILDNENDGFVIITNTEGDWLGIE
ncbi:hypothetical protein [Spiroplasma endosymbiont of Asaphidion curtum]|uniref:hypothetical protein n=1 Tax=Spiroplasma endosymbiont of Asaphidion curtum TaxID=3066281 RepID=UPI00313D9894